LGWTRILLILPIFSVSSFFLDKLLNIQRERERPCYSREIRKRNTEERGTEEGYVIGDEKQSTLPECSFFPTTHLVSRYRPVKIQNW